MRNTVLRVVLHRVVDKIYKRVARGRCSSLRAQQMAGKSIFSPRRGFTSLLESVNSRTIVRVVVCSCARCPTLAPVGMGTIVFLLMPFPPADYREFVFQL